MIGIVFGWSGNVYFNTAFHVAPDRVDGRTTTVIGNDV